MKASTSLTEARRRAGLSQSELAVRTGLMQPAISRIESGRSVPNVETLDRLLKACGEGLEPLPRPGLGVDRTVMQQLLKLSPSERLKNAVTEAHSLQRIRRSARP